MKTRLLAILAACLCCAACNTVVTETLDPITGKVIGRTTSSTIDSDAVTAGANTVAIIAASRANQDQQQTKGRVVADK